MIALIYPKYVGGKFITNCLALSKHCVVQRANLALKDIEYTGVDNTYYDFKLASVMKTIPPKELIRNWGKFEFGCDQLYGVGEEFYREKSVKEIRDYLSKNVIIKKLNEANKDSCIISHDYETFLKYLYIHNNAKIIEFKNFDQFRKLSALAKDPRPEHVYDEDYTVGANYYNRMRDFYQFDSFKIDVDATFMEWYPFNQMMMLLYDFMGFDDYNSELVYKFWVAYTNLHR